MFKGLLRFLYIKYLNKWFIKLFPIRGNKNIIINKNLIPDFSYRVIGNNNKINLAKGRYLKVKIFVNGSNNSIVIKENTNIKDIELWIEDNNCEIFIDSNTTIESAHLAAAEDNSKITIGKDCMISSNVRIVTTDSHSIIDQKTNKRINKAKDVYIGNHVWLGANVVVMKGSLISDNTVVGINSLVNKQFKNNNIIIAGQPAQQIKTNINWDRKRI